MEDKHSRKFEVVLVARDEHCLVKAEERLLFVLESTKRSMSMDGTERQVRMEIKKVGGLGIVKGAPSGGALDEIKKVDG